MDATPEYGSNLMPERPDTAAWNPVGLALIAVLLHMWPAGIFHALNYDRLGASQLRTSRLIQYSLVGLFTVLYGLSVSESTSRPVTYLPLIVNVLFGLHFYKSQWPLYEKHMAAGGTRAPFAYPLLAALLFVLVFLGLSYGYGLLVWGLAD